MTPSHYSVFKNRSADFLLQKRSRQGSFPLQHKPLKHRKAESLLRRNAAGQGAENLLVSDPKSSFHGTTIPRVPWEKSRL